MNRTIMQPTAVNFGKFVFVLVAVASATSAACAGTIVRFDTNMGTFDVELYDSAAPITVANFLSYVNGGNYDNTIVHRTVADFIVQGGGYTMPNWSAMPNNGTIPLEYNLPNVRGTLAMARAVLPNSATTQWFFNTVDNSAGLAPGGFTPDGYAVFGQVLGDGMDVVDAIEDLLRFNFSAQFANPALVQVPVIDYTPAQYSAGVDPRPYSVIVNSITVVPEPASWLLASCGGVVAFGVGWRRSRCRARSH
jgi:peptidyl-prolyl cis-trans isomerase A (cyclophilin A)